MQIESLWGHLCTPILLSLSTPLHTVCGGMFYLCTLIHSASSLHALTLCLYKSKPVFCISLWVRRRCSSLSCPRSVWRDTSWNKLKYKPRLWFQTLTSASIILSNLESSWSHRCMVTSPRTRKVIAEALVVIWDREIARRVQWISLPRGQSTNLRESDKISQIKFIGILKPDWIKCRAE